LGEVRNCKYACFDIISCHDMQRMLFRYCTCSVQLTEKSCKDVIQQTHCNLTEGEVKGCTEVPMLVENEDKHT